TWFTPRGSGVRIPHRPQTNKKVVRDISATFFIFTVETGHAETGHAETGHALSLQKLTRC
ncbi:MAG TPA: hypothetical protein PLS84_06500, partial [Salinivirgaceae bacterium]|nr:hypothetical protein [Salinivirgaceae bacterium]